MTEERTAETTPPADLPIDANAFWGEIPAELLAAAAQVTVDVPVIDQLGAAPFKKEKGGFPFLGFLASVYEHVAATAKAELHVAEAAPDATTEESEAMEEAEHPDADAAMQVFTTDPARHTDPIEERP